MSARTRFSDVSPTGAYPDTGSWDQVILAAVVAAWMPPGNVVSAFPYTSGRMETKNGQ